MFLILQNPFDKIRALFSYSLNYLEYNWSYMVDAQ